MLKRKGTTEEVRPTAAPSAETWVRRLGPTDVAVLEQLARENERWGAPGEREKLDPLSPADAREFLSDDRTVCLVAFEGDHPVGFLYACELYRRHSVLRHLCLYEIGVADDRRTHPIARQLVDALAAHARKRGVQRGFTVTNVSDRHAMELFAAAGGQRGADDDVVFAFRF